MQKWIQHENAGVGGWGVREEISEAAQQLGIVIVATYNTQVPSKHGSDSNQGSDNTVIFVSLISGIQGQNCKI